MAELNLVNTVELRIALAESEPQLEKALGQFLPPLLLKLASSNAEVRQAIFKIIQHVFPRISAAATLQLPVVALVQQAKTPNLLQDLDSSLVRLYSLLFASKGVERLSTMDQAQLLPFVVDGISSLPEKVAARMFGLLTKILVNLSPQDAVFTLSLDDTSRIGSIDDQKFLALKFTKFFLLPAQTGDQPILPSPGMSIQDIAFLTTNAGQSYKLAKELNAVKEKVLLFLRSQVPEPIAALPLLVASSDPVTTLADSALTYFRKLHADHEDAPFIDYLVALYLGVESSHPPVKPPLQDRILALFCLSKQATSHPKRLEIVKTGMLSSYARLRQTAVAFVRRIITTGFENPSDTLAFSIEISLLLKEKIQSEGWPQVEAGKLDYRILLHAREMSYETLGQLLAHCPDLLAKDFTYVEFLFTALEGESTDLRATVQNALLGLAIHLSKLSTKSQQKLKQLLFLYLLKSDPSNNILACKYIAVKYANTAFAFSDTEARIFCLLAASNMNNPEIIEEARKGLDPYQFGLNFGNYLAPSTQLDFPSFEGMTKSLVDCLQEMSGLNNIGFAEEALKFLFSILVMEAVSDLPTVIVIDEMWQVRIEKALEFDLIVQEKVDKKFKSLSGNQLFEEYAGILFEYVIKSVTTSTSGLKQTSSVTLLEYLMKYSSPSTTAIFLNRAESILKLIQEGQLLPHQNNKLSRIFAILVTHPANVPGVTGHYLELLQTLTSSNTGVKLYLTCTSDILSMMSLRGNTRSISESTLRMLLSTLEANIGNAGLYDTVVESLPKLSKYGTLGGVLSPPEVRNFISAITETILKKAIQFHEPSILALAYSTLFDGCKAPEGALNGEDIAEKIFEINDLKKMECMFVSGDALLIIAGGWSSQILLRNVEISGLAIPSDISASGSAMSILNGVLERSRLTKPSLRKSSCIWLLALVQNLGAMEVVKEQAPQIHLSFMRFLTDRDELIQDCAARGLGIIYDLGSVELQETLVKGLLKSFTDSNASSTLTAGSVDLDTELFDKDVLKTESDSISTYKDVLNLAADVGDPSLVYKFMALAKSNALWSSRRGMAYGLGSILAKSSLEKMLQTDDRMALRLIPKLYRYRFDPNVLVTQSMETIWQALVKDTPATIARYFEDIMGELVKGMGNKEWRVRQASASALNNLLQILSTEKYTRHIQQLFLMSFRSIDDIKESVRKEGQALTKTLTRLVIRQIELNSGSTSSVIHDILSQLIPFLMGPNGILSNADEVRTFALDTILKLCDKGKASIKPHVAEMISKLIELMSTLEPEVVNYLVLNSKKYNLDSDDIDAKRLQSLGQSPIIDALEKLIRLVDDSNLAAVIQGVISAVKSSVGLPSKACGSRIIVNLIANHPMLIKPHGDALLRVCISQLSDRNLSIRQSFAVAAGHCCKIASMASVISYSARLELLYFESDALASRRISAYASEAVSKFCGHDKFESLNTAFLPLAYIGLHDEDEYCSSLFEGEWVENTSGASAVKYFFKEITDICDRHMSSNSYDTRKILAVTLSDVCSKVDNMKREVFFPFLEMLLKACEGKSWLGKEKVFEALVKCCLNNVKALEEDTDMMQRTLKSIRTEQARRNKTYQFSIMFSVSDFIAAFPRDESLTSSYVETMLSVIDDDYLEDAGVIEEGDLPVKIEEVYLKIFMALLKASCGKIQQSEISDLLFEQMAIFLQKSLELSWRTCDAYNEIMTEHMNFIESNSRPEALLGPLPKRFELLMNFDEFYKIEKFVVSFARNCKQLSVTLKGTPFEPRIHPVKAKLQDLQGFDHSEVAQHELNSALLAFDGASN